jgi:hypothetical protein
VVLLVFLLALLLKQYNLGFLELGQILHKQGQSPESIDIYCPLFIGEREDVPAPVFKVVVLELLLSL